MESGGFEENIQNNLVPDKTPPLYDLFSGRLHQDGGEETGWCDEGWRELSQSLLSEPLQGCLQTIRNRYEKNTQMI